MNLFRIPDFNDLNPVFRHIDSLLAPEKEPYQRNVESRYQTVLKGGSYQFLAVIQNSFKAVGQTVGLGLKAIATPLSDLPKLSIIKGDLEKLPTLSSLWETVKRVVTVALGFLCTLFIGGFSPSTNNRIQEALGVFQPAENALDKLDEAAYDDLLNSF